MIHRQSHRMWRLLVLVMLLSSVGSAHAVTVCKQGPPTCDHATIGDALWDSEHLGEDVIVSPGIYSENDLWVGTSPQGGPRNLIADPPGSPETTIIDATGSDNLVISRFHGGKIQGFTIRGGKGGIRMSGGDVVLQDLIIEDNVSDEPGGGVKGGGGADSLTIIDCTIRRNRAPGGGGGVWANGPLTITGSTIEANEAFGDSIGHANGGGIHVRSNYSLVIEDTAITGNTLTGSVRNAGAGIWTPRTTTLNNVTITNNIAYEATSLASGGGIYKFAQTGSGLYLYIDGGAIAGNEADLGGGVFVSNTSRLILSGGAITHNIAREGIAGTSGGGVFCGATNVIESLTGTVSGNSPDELAGCGNADPPLGTTRTGRDNAQSGDSNDPVNTFTGELFSQYDADINLGGPMPLYFARYYSSGFKQEGVFSRLGDGWRHNFDWKLSIIGTTMHIVDHQGRTIQFIQNGPNWDLAGKADIVYQLVENAGVYTLVNPRNQHIYSFNSNGLLSSISDGKGNLHSLNYANGLLTEVSDGLGRILIFSYDENNYLTSVDDGLGRTVDLAHTGSYLTAATDLTGNTTVYNYATGSNITGWGLLGTELRPEGNIPFEHRYWSSDRRSSSETDSNGNKTIFRYDSATETTMEGPLGNTRVHTHTATGEFSNREDQAGQSFSMGSDATGRRNSLTDRLGDTTTIDYHMASGNVAAVNNADGTSRGYDNTARLFGNLTLYDVTGITHEDSTTESFVYDAAGNLTSHVDQAGHTTSGTYNANGQPLTATNAAGGVTTNIYNVDATLDDYTDPAGNTTTFGYDALKRPNLIISEDGSTFDFTYDDADRLLTTTDENGNTTTLAYDLNGNLDTITDPLGSTATYTYDGNDRPLTATDQLGGVASVSYDALGRLETITDENSNTTTNSYNTLRPTVTIPWAA